MKWSRLIRPLTMLAAAGAAGYGVWYFKTVQAAPALPTTPARKGEFLVTVRCRGELKARRSVQIGAPLNVPDLRIVWMAPAGTMVKAGDSVVRFDPSSAQQQLDERTAGLRQADAALRQALAETRLQAEQDRLELNDAAHLLERAKIEVSKAELVSKLQGEEAEVDLELARQKVAVQQAKLNFNSASNAAKIASLERQRDKARDDVEISESRVKRMEVRAPIDGMVSYQQNFSQGWMNAKPFKVGDQVWPGSVIGQIPDLASLEMEGKIEEIDRGQMSVDQEVNVRIDALPESMFPGSLAQLSPLTEMGWEWPPTRTFRGFAKIQKPDPRLRPGMNGRMDVVMKRIPDAISVPAKAVFTMNGKPVVYVAKSGGYRPVEVEVVARNPDEAAVKGIAEGALVAMVEPDRSRS
jgi:multidrug efflux pump subunit AcrA (membrane-fusion protein)